MSSLGLTRKATSAPSSCKAYNRCAEAIDLQGWIEPCHTVPKCLRMFLRSAVISYKSNQR